MGYEGGFPPSTAILCISSAMLSVVPAGGICERSFGVNGECRNKQDHHKTYQKDVMTVLPVNSNNVMVKLGLPMFVIHHRNNKVSRPGIHSSANGNRQKGGTGS